MLTGSTTNVRFGVHKLDNYGDKDPVEVVYLPAAAGTGTFPAHSLSEDGQHTYAELYSVEYANFRTGKQDDAEVSRLEGQLKDAKGRGKHEHNKDARPVDRSPDGTGKETIPDRTEQDRVLASLGGAGTGQAQGGFGPGKPYHLADEGDAPPRRAIDTARDAEVAKGKK